VAGLVGITPAAGFVYIGPSIIIGALSAVACFIAVRVKAAIKFDDSLDTFMVHGVGGTLGALLTGIFASKTLVPADYFPLSAEIMEKSGNFGMFIAQLKAVLFSYGFVAIATALILLILKAFMPLRVTAEEEDRGLDFVAHGEEAYDPMTN
ncbi:MAG: ammonia channel protein, partial [Cyanobacteriota bacterium]